MSDRHYDSTLECIMSTCQHIHIWQLTRNCWTMVFLETKFFLGKLLIFMKFFENIFSSGSYALNLAFWKNFTNLPIYRDICLNRFLYKIKWKFLENWAIGFWCYVKTKCILYKYKNYCFWEYSAKISHSLIKCKNMQKCKNKFYPNLPKIMVLSQNPSDKVF